MVVAPKNDLSLTKDKKGETDDVHIIRGLLVGTQSAITIERPGIPQHSIVLDTRVAGLSDCPIRGDFPKSLG